MLHGWPRGGLLLQRVGAPGAVRNKQIATNQHYNCGTLLAGRVSALSRPRESEPDRHQVPDHGKIGVYGFRDGPRDLRGVADRRHGSNRMSVLPPAAPLEEEGRVVRAGGPQERVVSKNAGIFLPGGQKYLSHPDGKASCSTRLDLTSDSCFNEREAKSRSCCCGAD
jgi:hypothetical protein